MKSITEKLNSFRHSGKGICFLKSRGYTKESDAMKVLGYRRSWGFEKLENGYRLHFASVPGNTRSHFAVDFLKGAENNENETV